METSMYELDCCGREVSLFVFFLSNSWTMRDAFAQNYEVVDALSSANIVVHPNGNDFNKSRAPTLVSSELLKYAVKGKGFQIFQVCTRFLSVLHSSLRSFLAQPYLQVDLCSVFTRSIANWKVSRSGKKVEKYWNVPEHGNILRLRMMRYTQLFLS